MPPYANNTGASDAFSAVRFSRLPGRADVLCAHRRTERPVRRLIRYLRRFWLKQRIEMLRADIMMATERHSDALANVEALDRWIEEAHRRSRAMKARLAMIENPKTLLEEALRHE